MTPESISGYDAHRCGGIKNDQLAELAKQFSLFLLVLASVKTKLCSSTLFAQAASSCLQCSHLVKQEWFSLKEQKSKQLKPETCSATKQSTDCSFEQRQA